MSVGSRRRYLESQMSALQDQLAALDELPQLDDFPDGTIIRCVVEENDRTTQSGIELAGKRYTWVFLKITQPLPLNVVSVGLPTVLGAPEVRWYFTGRLPTARNTSIRWVTWAQLVDFLIARSRRVVSWDVVWPVVAEDVTIEYADGKKAVVPGGYDYKTEGLGGT